MSLLAPFGASSAYGSLSPFNSMPAFGPPYAMSSLGYPSALMLNPPCTAPLNLQVGATMQQLLDWNQHHMPRTLYLALHVNATDLSSECDTLRRTADALIRDSGLAERVALEATLQQRVRQAESQLRAAKAATKAHAARIATFESAAAQRVTDEASAAKQSVIDSRRKRQRTYDILGRPAEEIVAKDSSPVVKQLAVAIHNAVAAEDGCFGYAKCMKWMHFFFFLVTPPSQCKPPLHFF